MTNDDEKEDSLEQVLFLIDLAIKSKTIEEKNKHLEDIKDITKHNLMNI